MQRVRITSDGTAMGTKVTAMDGTPIPGLTRVALNPIVPDDAVTAELDVAMAKIDVEAFAFMSLQACCEVAAFYGYRLVKTDADAA